jgi:hypothetical protein
MFASSCRSAEPYGRVGGNINVGHEQGFCTEWASSALIALEYRLTSIFIIATLNHAH